MTGKRFYVTISILASGLALVAIHEIGVSFIFQRMLLESHQGQKLYYCTQCLAAILIGLALVATNFVESKLKLWRFLIMAVVGTVIFSLSYTVSEFIFDQHRILNSLRPLSFETLASFMAVTFVLIPLTSGAWLAGPLAGALFMLMEKYFTKHDRQGFFTQ